MKRMVLLEIGTKSVELHQIGTALSTELPRRGKKAISYCKLNILIKGFYFHRIDNVEF